MVHVATLQSRLIPSFSHCEITGAPNNVTCWWTLLWMQKALQVVFLVCFGERAWNLIHIFQANHNDSHICYQNQTTNLIQSESLAATMVAGISNGFEVTAVTAVTAPIGLLAMF